MNRFEDNDLQVPVPAYGCPPYAFDVVQYGDIVCTGKKDGASMKDYLQALRVLFPNNSLTELVNLNSRVVTTDGFQTRQDLDYYRCKHPFLTFELS